MSTPPLFQSDARKKFMTTTADRYRHLSERLSKKKLPPPPFSLAQLRNHILEAMGESYTGGLRCPYCGRVCDISEVEFDHRVPLNRGGGLGLDNISAPCAGCNSAKGQSTDAEWVRFMGFLERELPLARVDILHRLTMYGKLVSGKRKAEMLARNGGQMPAKKPKPGKPPLIAVIEEQF
jgi:hypothetical protein